MTLLTGRKDVADILIVYAVYWRADISMSPFTFSGNLPSAVCMV